MCSGRSSADFGHRVIELGIVRVEHGRKTTEYQQLIDPQRRVSPGVSALTGITQQMVGVHPSVSHRALADAQATALVFEKLMAPVGGWGICFCDEIREQGGPMGLLPVSPREGLLPLELEEAIEQRKPVMMEYLDGNGNRTRRVIETLHVRRASGELLLIAHCQLRGERRTFKLERIVQLARLEPLTPADRVESPHGQTPAGNPAPGDAAWDPIAVDSGPDRPSPVDSGSV